MHQMKFLRCVKFIIKLLRTTSNLTFNLYHDNVHKVKEDEEIFFGRSQINIP
jgi:hypothetical protein